ncbi:inorganic diphosphatase [Mesonia sediminis]|uniref:inorganic diphosphatase n=1 Tax=Mesonia sediminis TaxID=1703946 RepID=UPI00366B272D
MGLSGNYQIWLLLMGFISLSSCKQGEPATTNLYEQNSFKNGQLQSIISTTAGSLIKNTYQIKDKRFLPDTSFLKQGKIKYLALPFSIGFIPSTQIELGKSNRPLEVLLVNTDAKQAQTVGVKLLALLKVATQDTITYKLVGIDSGKSQAWSPFENFEELAANHPDIIKTINRYFEDYRLGPYQKVLSWQDEQAALKFVKAHQVN